MVTQNTDLGFYNLPTISRDELDGRHAISFVNKSVLSIALLLNGTVEQLRKATKEQVVRSMWAITKVDLPLIKKLVIWDIIKEYKTSRQLKKDTLEATGNFLLSIPDTDLYDLNVSDWNIVDYLGTLHGLTRRQAGIVAYALKNQWGDNIITSIEHINRMKGLVCGFSPNDIDGISSSQFRQISGEVFENIGACTPRQKRVLLYKAMSSSAYGPPQAWSSSNTEKLGLLISIIDKDTLPRIRPEAMEGIIPSTIKAMSKDQLDGFTDEQIDYLSDLSLTAYRAAMGVTSDRQGRIVGSCVLILASIFCLLVCIKCKQLCYYRNYYY